MAAASFSSDRRVPAATVAVAPSMSMTGADRSRSVDSTTVGGSAGGTDAPTNPLLAP